MKITIEVEIQPDEVGLAAELLGTLRALTDHVKLVTPGVPAAAVAPSAAPSATAAAPAGALHAASALQAQAAQALPNGAIPGLQHAAGRPASVPAQQPPAAAPAAPAPAAPAAAAPSPGLPAAAPHAPSPAVPSQLAGTPQPFKLSVPRLGNPATQEQAIADIIAALRANPDAAVDELIAAYEQQVFDNHAIIQEGVVSPTMPYMALYPRLPDDLRLKVRDKMVQKVLLALTKKRPVTADRTSFFAYADAFAALVKFEAVPMDGAVATLSRLLVKVDNRSAGVTMLGKTIEYCGEQLLRTNEAKLAELWRALENVKEEGFQYDMYYISAALQGLQPGAAAAAAAAAPQPGAAAPGAPAAAPPGASAAPTGAAAPAPAAPAAPSTGGAAAMVPTCVTTPTSLAHVGCYTGHASTVFTLCWDAAHGQLTSGGQDGQLLAWGPEGTPVGRVDVSSHYVCSLDILPRSGTLLAAAVPVDQSNPEIASACVLAFTPPLGAVAGQPRMGAWSPRGRLYGMHRGIISFVRALGGDGELFATGENPQQGSGTPDIVCLYDASRGGALEQMSPLTVYSEHTDMVTCASPWNANPNVFVTGSRDKSILVWDRRMAQSVGSFGDPDGTTGRTQAHADMVTCLDTTDNLLLSSSVDCSLGIWDFRQLGMTHGSVTGAVVKVQIDSQPTLKVAVTGAPHSRLAAVSTYQGLYVMDFTEMSTPRTLVAPPFADNRPFKYYHDIHWAGGPNAPGQPVLFGASDDPRIDVFALSFV